MKLFLFILFLPSFGFAKQFIVEEAPGKLVCVKRTRPPAKLKSFRSSLPDEYCATQSFTVEDVVNDEGVVIRQQAEKDDDALAAFRLVQRTREQAKQAKRDRIKAKADALDKQLEACESANTAVEVRTCTQRLAKWLRPVIKRLLPEELDE